MSGAIARNPSPAKTGSWCRQLIDSSGQPCRNSTTGPSSGPAARYPVVCRSVRSVWATISDIASTASVAVVDDVHDVAVGRPHQEPAHAPGLLRQRAHDLEAQLLRLRPGGVD